MTTLVAATRKAILLARSPADFYRISIELQQLATPDDIEALHNGSAAMPPSFGNWLTNFHQAVTLHNKRVHVFERNALAENVSMYTGGNGAKTLIIGFCGQANLLCTPIPIMLQYFAPTEFDLLLLRDTSWRGYTHGIPGYADTFSSLLERLGRDVDLSRYESLRIIGTSGGGAAALAAGIALGAARVASFSGHTPVSSPTYGKTPTASEMETRLRKSRLEKGRAFGVYGASNIADKNNALELARLMEIKLVPIDGLADHVVIHPLHLRGQLANTFTEVGLLEASSVIESGASSTGPQTRK